MNELNEKALEQVSGGADLQIRSLPSDQQIRSYPVNTETVLR